MGEMFAPKFEGRPELDPSRVELLPSDRLRRLILLFQGEFDLVAADFSGLEAAVRWLMEERRCDFSVLPETVEEGAGFAWGRSYEEQRWRLAEILGWEETADLEKWGAELLAERDRGNRKDRRTGLRGVVVGQVFLDFFRFSISDELPGIAEMNGGQLAERINARRRNWSEDGKRVKNPTPCSGEMIALVLHYIRTGEKADWKK